MPRQTVTWLLPVRNGMPYLPRTLASIASQTYPHHKILAWDNGSTDGTVQVLRQWIPDRIAGRVVVGRPLGLGASLAAMIEQVDTDLCARIDADDLNEPDRLARQVEYLAAHQGVAMLGTNLWRMRSDETLMADQPHLPTGDADLRWLLRFGNPVAHPSVMFRRQAVVSIGNYRDLDPGVEDRDLWIRLAMRYRLANLSERLVRYRVHENSVTAARYEQAQRCRQRMIEGHLEMLYPGASAPRARRLMDMLQPGRTGTATTADLLALRRVGGGVARQAGESPGYIRQCATFRHHWSRMRRMWWRGAPGAARAWQWLHQSPRRQAA